MTFDRAWVLFLLPLAAAFALAEWRRAASRISVVLKAVALAAILLALSEPNLSVVETKLAVAVLVDTSASVSDSDLERAGTARLLQFWKTWVTASFWLDAGKFNDLCPFLGFVDQEISEIRR